MVVTGCSVVTGDCRYKATIVVVAIPIIGHDVFDVGVWVEACPYDVDGCVSSNYDIDISGLVFPPPGVIGSFPVIVNV